MAKKKASKKTPSKRRYWNVWIDCSAKMDYFAGRDKIEASCGRSGGSGTGFDSGWDVSYHGKTFKNAQKIANKAKRFRFVKKVRVYQDDPEDNA